MDLSGLTVANNLKAKSRSKVSASALKLIAQGGTARVYALPVVGGRKAAVKLYLNPEKVDWEKISYQISHPIEDYNFDFTWPAGIIFRGSKPVGFVQKLLDPSEYLALDHWVEQPLFAALPTEYKRLSTKLSILFNLARAIEVLHNANVAIVDLKPSNIFIKNRTFRVGLIDCDGFRVETSEHCFPAKEATVGYIDPKATRNRTAVTELSYDQDQYAFSVLSFQILNFGIHPYQAIYEETASSGENIEARSEQGLYAYGTSPCNGATPVLTSVHTCWPNILIEVFDRSFAPGRNRITIAEWAKLLLQIDQARLIEVCLYDAQHEKFFGYPCPDCQREKLIKRALTRPQINGVGSLVADRSWRASVAPQKASYLSQGQMLFIFAIAVFVFVLFVINAP